MPRKGLPPLEPIILKLKSKREAKLGGSPVPLYFPKSKSEFSQLFRDKKGSIFVVVCYADWCPACHRYCPSLLGLFPKDGVVVIMLEEKTREQVWPDAPIQFYPTLFLQRNETPDASTAVEPESIDKLSARIDKLLLNTPKAARSEPSKPVSIVLAYNPTLSYRPGTQYAITNAKLLKNIGYPIEIRTDPKLTLSPTLFYGSQSLYGPHANSFLVALIDKSSAQKT